MSKVIVGTGSDLPERVITNHHIEERVADFDRDRAGLNLDDWAMARCGVRERRRVEDGEGTSDMAVRAARSALADAEMEAGEIDLIVLATCTSDYKLPQSVNIVQDQLGTQAKCPSML